MLVILDQLLVNRIGVLGGLKTEEIHGVEIGIFTVEHQFHGLGETVGLADEDQVLEDIGAFVNAGIIRGVMNLFTDKFPPRRIDRHYLI